MSVKDKCGKCQGKLQTNLQDEVLSKTDSSCVPKLTGIEVKVKVYNCRNRDREDVPVHARTAYKEDVPVHARTAYKEDVPVHARTALCETTY